MTTGAMAARAEPGTRARRRGFHVGMALAIMAVAVVGFAERYYLKIHTGTLDLPALVHVHAAVFTSWLLLLLAQTTLVAARRVDLHRRLGLAGVGLAALVVVLGVAVSIHGARHGWNPGRAFRTPLEFMIVPLWDIATFGGFVAAGLHHRRRPELHRRLMLLATVGGMLWAAVTRIPAVRGNLPAMLGVMALFALAGPVHDLATRGRVHPINAWGGLLVLASVPLRALIARTEAWHAVAAWLVGG